MVVWNILEESPRCCGMFENLCYVVRLGEQIQMCQVPTGRKLAQWVEGSKKEFFVIDELAVAGAMV